MASIGHIASFGLFQLPRILKYRLLSTCRRVEGRPHVKQPVLYAGGGRILFGKSVQLGWNPSPFLYCGYIFIAALHDDAIVEIQDDVAINNNAVLYSLGAGITVGEKTIIGTGVEIYDSDFHWLEPGRRGDPHPPSARVEIGRNVFIGSNARILKGVSLGENTVVGCGSVVTRSCPPNSLVAGNPARVVRAL